MEAEFQIAYVDPGKLAGPKTGTIMKDMHYTQKMKLSFAIDPKFWATPTEIVPVNQSFVIDGEKVTLTEIERSPVQTLTRFKFSDEVNADWERKQNIISDLLFNLSYIRGGVKTELVPYRGNGTDEGYENMFEGNSLDTVDALLLELIRSEPKQQIRVDLNQK
ncbi:hypothetical protein B9T62_10420 [Paenibacillus donghaensis]|uniref:Uncharacterized protein n=1 Tax=Paenibacillus donghaensis TaxID=414771 RepID=A0A2Z2K7Q9_9BACL|nr:hypothetical protein B9T62_10420 [Paenibacillus donghaensis]